MSNTATRQALEDEIVDLEARIAGARSKLDAERSSHLSSTSPIAPILPQYAVTSPSHALLLLSDSALPLGSFAFSSGLESYLAHHPSPTPPPIQPFLALALETLATTTLPYLVAAYCDPSQLQELDDTLDACLLCHVTRRASLAQGRALLTVWERAFRGTVDPVLVPAKALADLSLASKKMSARTGQGIDAISMPISGHFGPIWAVVTQVLGIPIHESLYVFLLNHAKAVLSAAVRASVVGPYQAQAVLGSLWLKGEIERLMQENWDIKLEDAGQGVPAMDLWVGRHEMLYSRIFNS